jgi:hypothetical protein
MADEGGMEWFDLFDGDGVSMADAENTGDTVSASEATASWGGGKSTKALGERPPPGRSSNCGFVLFSQPTPC